jgi:hypothetical protein
MILATERMRIMTDNEKYIFEELVIEGQSRVRNDFHRAVAAIAEQDHSVARTHIHLTALAQVAAYGLAEWHSPQEAANIFRKMADRLEAGAPQQKH